MIVQGEPLTIVRWEPQTEDASPSTESATIELVSSDTTEQVVSTKEPVAVTAPDLNQSNIEANLNEEVVSQSRIINYHPVDNIIRDVSHGVQM